MEARNLKHAPNGMIDMEINHATLGWIPFTASANDPGLGAELHAQAVAGDFGPIAEYVALPPQVPVVVSRFQAKVALDAWQLLDDVEAIMADPATPLMYRMAWAEATEFYRDSATVAALGQMLALTDAQLDELFIYAGGVQA